MPKADHCCCWAEPQRLGEVGMTEVIISSDLFWCPSIQDPFDEISEETPDFDYCLHFEALQMLPLDEGVLNCAWKGNGPQWTPEMELGEHSWVPCDQTDNRN